MPVYPGDCMILKSLGMLLIASIILFAIEQNVNVSESQNLMRDLEVARGTIVIVQLFLILGLIGYRLASGWQWPTLLLVVNYTQLGVIESTQNFFIEVSFYVLIGVLTVLSVKKRVHLA